VLATKGPLLVLAGAGAGKTRVITHRILQLVKEGAAPDEILAITFTNKAAGEMRTRTLELLAKNRQGPTLTQGSSRSVLKDVPFVSTFHSLGLLIIKENFRALGLKRRPSIYDRADSMRLIKEALKQIGADGEIEPRAALGTISRHKGEGVTAGQYAEAAQTGRERTLAAIWLSYERALAADSALADLAPIPDKGPPIGDAGGLSFKVQSVEVEMGPANGPHYKKAAQVVVLTGCAEGTPNCALAQAKNLVGMEVAAVDGVQLAATLKLALAPAVLV